MHGNENIDPLLNLRRKYRPIFKFAWKNIDPEKNLYGIIFMPICPQKKIEMSYISGSKVKRKPKP